MFDLPKFLELTIGGLLRPRETWESWLGESPTWQRTAVQLTAPLIVAAVLIGSLLARVLGGWFSFGYGHGVFAGLVIGLVSAVISVTVASLVISILAGAFGGRTGFDRAFAAVSMAFVPGWVGMALSGIPWLGFLLQFAGAIVGLVFLYKIIPLALEVPEGKRVLHFVLALVVIFVINLVISSLFGAGQHGASGLTGRNLGDARVPAAGSWAHTIERQARLSQQAHSDRYDPPGDARLSEGQMRAFVADLTRARELRDQRLNELQTLSEDLEGKEPSLSDLGRMMSASRQAISLVNLEIEVVKERGGNWAEHQWIREQLMQARVLRDDTPVSAHNWAYYQRHAELLDSAL